MIIINMPYFTSYISKGWFSKGFEVGFPLEQTLINPYQLKGQLVQWEIEDKKKETSMGNIWVDSTSCQIWIQILT